MDFHSHNRTGRAISVVVTAVAWLCLAPAEGLRAQTAVAPTWSAPPPTVWIIPPPSPQPVWIVPYPSVTAFYPPVDAGIANETLSVDPPSDVQLRVTLSESLLSTLMAREVTNSGPIRDRVQGADLYGDQLTVTQLSVDCQPCATQARLQLRLIGSVTDHTIGVTRPAHVQSEGRHRFQMTKQVDFDGRQFTTRSPAAWVTPQITYRGASTVVSGVPVIGRIGSAIALNEAERRRPAIEQYALKRVTRTAAPRFNAEVDQRLSRANEKLSTYSPAFFKKWGLSLADQTLATADDRLYYGLRIPALSVHESERLESPAPSDVDGPVFLGIIDESFQENLAHSAVPDAVVLDVVVPDAVVLDADVLDSDARSFKASSVEWPLRSAPPIVEGSAMTILIHEDFVNHILNRLSLGGREVPDRLIDHMMQMLLDVLARKSLKGMSFDLSNRVDSEFRVEPEFATLLLDQDRPLSIQFGEGQAVLTLRSGFQTLLGREMPTQRVKIPFRVSTGEQQVTLEPGEVTVSPMSADDGPLIGLARPVIRQQVEQRLQSMAVARTVPLAIPGMVPTTLTVRDVVLQDGWLAITFD